MFCPKCGKQIPDTSRFCGGCGSAVTPLAGGDRTSKAPKPEKPSKAPKPPKTEKPPKEPKPPKQPKQPKTQQEDGGKKVVLILGIVLAVLVLVAAGMGVYYFAAVKDGGRTLGNLVEREADEETEEDTDEEENTETEEPAGTEDVGQEENADESSEEDVAKEEETPEEDAVVSDTNEVVLGKVLKDIPKAVYSYRFDGELGNAEVVVREQPDSEPETADGEKAQYARGMDGEAVLLDGSYGLKLSDVKSVGDSYTVAFWIKAEELYDWAPFIHVGQNLLDESGRCRLWIGQKPDGDGGSVGPILSSERASTNVSVEIRPDNTAQLYVGVWYHVAFTVDGSARGSQSDRVLGTLYLAGKKIGQGDVVTDAMSGDDFEVYLGINCWDQLYPAAFDDVKIWNQALSEEQIAALCEAYE